LKYCIIWLINTVENPRLEKRLAKQEAKWHPFTRRVKQHEVMGTREGTPSLFLASLKLREKSDLASHGGLAPVNPLFAPLFSKVDFSKVDLLFQTRKYLKIYGKTMYNV